MRPDAGHRRLDRDAARDLGHALERGLVEQADRAVRVDVLAEDHGLVGRVARDRVGVLERQHAPARRVGAGALELLRARARSRAGRRRSRACTGRPRGTCRTRARPTAAGSARRRTSARPSRRSRRARAARGSRRTGASPSSRPAASSRSPARRAARGRAGRPAGGRRCAGATGWSRAPRRASAARTPAPARSRRSPRCPGSGRRSRPASPSSGTCSRLPTRNAPPREPAHWRSRKATIASRVKLWMCSGGPSTGRPSGWSPNAARSIRCSATTDGVSFARAISCTTTPRSRSSSPASIFGTADEVGQQVDRLRDHLGAAGEVEGDDVVRRVGVEHRAHVLGGLVDLAVVVVVLAALEHQVLEEVRHPVLLGALGAGAGLEGDEHGGGTRALELDVVDGEAVVEGVGADGGHT